MKLLALPLLALATLLGACASAPTARPPDAGLLPADPAVHRGQLPNGLSYYLRHNAHPERTISLQLVVKAGSLMEAEDERGLAHFVEHMAFNGTRHYPKNALVAELEAMGVEFGSHVNAFTGYGETVYQLSLPSERPENLGKALTILRDWADGIAFSEAEVVKERGVVLEEWRSRKGVGERLQEQILPLLYAGTRYLTRKPIGEPAIIQAATAQQLQAFYRRWYVPGRMAVIAVGDIEPEALAQNLRQHFGSLPTRSAPPAPEDSLSREPGLHYATVLDAENTVTTAELSVVQPQPVVRTPEDYRQLLVRELALAILDERLEDKVTEAGTGLLAAGVSASPLDRRHSLYTLAARTEPERVLPAFAALQKELSRALDLGVSTDELERHKADFLAGLRQNLRDERRIASSGYVEDYAAHYLNGEAYLSVAEELARSEALLPGIRPEDVRSLYRQLFGGPDRLALVSGRAQAGLAYPQRAQVEAALSAAAAQAPEALAQGAGAQGLMSRKPAPGRLRHRRELPELGVTELEFDNGLKVLLKPTDFQETEILMHGWSRGGLSQVDDARYRDAAISADLVAESGFGAHSLKALKKLTAGQLLSLSPYIGETEEGVSGSAQPEDLEALLQLTHLAFTAPRLEPSVFTALRGRLADFARSRAASSEQRFEDAVRRAYTLDHPRYRPWQPETIAGLDAEQALAAYRERFADAGDFAFVFVGKFEVEAVLPLLARYLGSLPDRGLREQARDRSEAPFLGQHALTLREAPEPRTQVRLLFTGPASWNRDELYVFGSLRRILETRLRQEIRENLSGVYDISLAGELSPYPQAHFEAQISFVCAPERAEELTAAVRRVIATLRREGVRADEIATVRAAQAQEYRMRSRDNGAWLQTLKVYRDAGWDARGILLRDFPALSPKLTPVLLQAAAQRYFGLENSLLAQLTPPLAAAAPAGAGAR